MLNLYALAGWLSTIIIGSFALIIFLGGNTRASRVYATTATFVALWTFGIGASYVVEVETMLFWERWNYFMGGLIAAAFFYFSHTFPNERPSRVVSSTVLISQLFFAFLYARTGLIIHDTFLIAGTRAIDRGWHFGSLGLLFHIFFFSFFIGGFLVLFQKMRAASLASRRDLGYLFWGSIIGVTPAAVVNIFLPLAGNFSLDWLGPLLILGWIAVLSYAIARHHLWSVKVLIAEVAVLSMTFVLFINIFLEEVLSFGMLGRLVVFLVFVLVGAFLIVSIRSQDAQKIELQILAAKLRDLNENLQQIVDVRTAQLSHSKAHIETLIENLTSGLIEYSKDYVVLRMNRAAERLLDIDRSKVVGKRIMPEDRKRTQWQALVAVTYPPKSARTRVEGELLDEQSAASVHEVVVGYPTNNEYQVITAPIRVEGGKPEGLLKVIRDITREKQINRSKSEFISIAAHQLRTPLSALKWCIDLLLKGDFGALNEKQREMLQRGYETNETMIQLVGDLLNVAKIEDRRFGYEFTKGDIVSLVTKIVSSVSISFRELGITFEFQKPTIVIPRFFFDEAKISLAIRNVLENAIHYTPKGGRVNLAIALYDRTVEISISDTGIGIPKKQLDRLFTRFFRAENAIRSHPEGSGLGLFMVENIITRHGGTVTVDSLENKGTTVKIILPIRTDPPTQEKSLYD